MKSGFAEKSAEVFAEAFTRTFITEKKDDPSEKNRFRELNAVAADVRRCICFYRLHRLYQRNDAAESALFEKQSSVFSAGTGIPVLQ